MEPLPSDLPSKSFKRKQILVDVKYQVQFATRIFMAVLAVAVFSSLIATSLLWRNMYQPDMSQQPHIIASLIAVAVTLLIQLLLSIPIIFYLGIKQSHRVVGPLGRIKRTLEAIGTGDFTQRITLRPGDVLEDLAKAINVMAESLQRKFPTPPK